jgi:hypothetical protein
VGRPSSPVNASLGRLPPHVGQQRGPGAGGALQRVQGERDPGVPGVGAGGAHHLPGLHRDHAESVLVEVAAQGRGQARDVGAHHEPQLAVRVRGPGDGVDRDVRVPGGQGQHFEGVPPDHALGWGEPGLTPARVDAGVAGAPADGDGAQRGPDRPRNGRRAQRGDQDPAAGVHQAGHRAGRVPGFRYGTPPGAPDLPGRHPNRNSRPRTQRPRNEAYRQPTTAPARWQRA